MARHYSGRYGVLVPLRTGQNLVILNWQVWRKLLSAGWHGRCYCQRRLGPGQVKVVLTTDDGRVLEGLAELECSDGDEVIFRGTGPLIGA